MTISADSACALCIGIPASIKASIAMNENTLNKYLFMLFSS